MSGVGLGLHRESQDLSACALPLSLVLAGSDAKEGFEEEHSEADGHDEAHARLGVEWTLLLPSRGRDYAVRHGEMILEILDVVTIKD